MELRLTDCKLFRNFDWILADPMRGVDMYSYGQHIQTNMLLVPYQRKR